VQATNIKLRDRRDRMLIHLTGRERQDVRGALERARGHVKLAVLLLEGCELAEAEELLGRAGGRLREALASMRRREPAR
jgi:N-acetylmuramic acid 6-phosphate etherase